MSENIPPSLVIVCVTLFFGFLYLVGGRPAYVIFIYTITALEVVGAVALTVWLIKRFYLIK